MPPERRNNKPDWDVVRDMLHKRLKEVSAELNAPIPYLRHLCHQNGYSNGWPGKEMRYMNRIGRDMMLRVAAREAAGPSQQLAKIAKNKKKEEDEDITGIQEPVVNPPPRKELVTLNLIDKVGSSSGSKSN